MLVKTEINGRGEAGQDHFAYDSCGRKRTGTFLDIGCNEPRLFNNTYALEEIGWRGWGLDINPDYAEAWARERKSPFYCCDARFADWQKSPLPSFVDYLSLDIDENEERNLATRILRRLFDAGLSFRCATIEHDAYRYGDHPRSEIRELMLAHGYRLAYPDVEIRQHNKKPFEDWWTRD